MDHFNKQVHKLPKVWDCLAAQAPNNSTVQGKDRIRSPDQASADLLLPKRPCFDDIGRSMAAINNYNQPPCGGGRDDGRPCRTPHDVVFHVGKLRRAYHVSSDSLSRGSTYFKNFLHSKEIGESMMGPIVMDCEEAIFESMLALMRYGTFDALPPMSEAEMFKLRREVEFYGIHAIESPKTATHSGRSSLSTSPSTSPSASPKISPSGVSSRLSGRHAASVAPAATVNSTRQLAELPDFPLDLADPAKLVLVSCLDQEKGDIFTCDSCRPAGPTQWALNFHHRHAFCAACGRRATRMPAKYFAEMFMAAASHYYGGSRTPDKGTAKSAWWVGADSTCTLRFVSGSGADACTSCKAEETVWGANCFYSHAFCTRCGDSAHGPVLLSLLLALRYGGAIKGAKLSRSSFKNRSPPAA